MSTHSYNLQLINGVDVSALYDMNNVIEKDTISNLLKLSIKPWKYNDNDYTVIRYNKHFMSEGLVKTSGLFRSVILNNDGNIVSFAPPKSLSPDMFCRDHATEQADCRVEKYIEGTMINVFHDGSGWEIATRSTVGGNVKFFNGVSATFRSMFFEVMGDVGLEFGMLDTRYMYSFVFQHNLNRIVTVINENALYLVKMYEIDNATRIVYERDHREYVANHLSSTRVRVSEIYSDATTFEAMKELYASPVVAFDNVGVMVYAPNGDRTKFRNPNYEEVRHLRGNQPKLHYHYLNLRKVGRVGEYLNFFPEHSELFTQYRDQLHHFTSTLYFYYIQCYIKKLCPLKEYPYQYRKAMYELHQYYVSHLKEEKKYITKADVIQYVNKLHPSQQMFLLNYHLRGE